MSHKINVSSYMLLQTSIIKDTADVTTTINFVRVCACKPGNLEYNHQDTVNISVYMCLD